MKSILVLLLSLSTLCHAQDKYVGLLEQDDITTAQDTIKRTYWEVLERATANHRLNTFFRISSINGNFYLDLKVMEGGSMFIAAKDAELKFRLSDNRKVTLYNTAYTHSCLGCGARGYGGSGAEGALISYRIQKEDMQLLLHSYIEQMRIYGAYGYLEANITSNHSELFMDQLALVYEANGWKTNAE